MPNVLNEFAGDGVTQTFNFSMTGGYLSRDYVYFFTRPNDDLLNYTPYNDDDVTWLTDFSVRTANPIPVGTTFVILRSTTLDPLVDFQNTSRITEKNLDTATWQAVHIAAETSDTVGRIQVVATDAKRESADALLNAQAAAADASTAAGSAVAASQAASAAQAAAVQAGADAGTAARSAQEAANTATAAELTANVAAADAATAVNTANTAASAANSAVTTAAAAQSAASAAVSTANAANTTAGTAASDAAAAVVSATNAVGVANTAMSVATEAKELIDEAVSGAVVSFNGRAGVVVPETGDYSKGMVGLGEVDNTSDLNKPVSTATATALSSKVDKVSGKQLSTEDYTSAEKAKLAGVAAGATANATDAALRDRSTHTGTQPITTISGLEAQTSAGVVAAIAMAQTFTSVPSTFQAWVIFVTQPHWRTFVWDGTKYVRAPWHRPGIMFHSDAPAATVTHGIQMRSDVTYNAADYPDLAAAYGFTGSTFVLKDARARVIRGADLGCGIDTALVNGYLQEDAIRNLTGFMNHSITSFSGYTGDGGEGVLRGTLERDATVSLGSSGGYFRLSFDASRQVPTASENRVKSLVATTYVTI